MQIHELNKKKKLEEGVFDSLVDPVKAAAQTVKTGYQQGGIKGADKFHNLWLAIDQIWTSR